MSIRRELLLTLVSALAIAVCIAALVVYYRVREQTGEVLDYQLRQMALALRDETMQGFGAFKVPPPGFDYAIQIASENGLELRYTRSRIQLPSVSGTGYADIDTAEGTWRLYALRSGGVSIQVAQSMYVRDELAARAAWRTVAPFVLLLPLLALLVWIAVTRGLRPLECPVRCRERPRPHLARRGTPRRRRVRPQACSAARCRRDWTPRRAGLRALHAG